MGWSVRTVAIALVVAGCVGSGSAERQALGRAGDGNVEEGPLEQVVTDRMEARDAMRQEQAALLDREAEASPGAERERRMQAAVAWDLRLLDVLGSQLAASQELADFVADHGDTEELRAWADQESADVYQWRRELARLRATWYGDPRPPGVNAAPGIDDLGPVTEDLATRGADGARDTGALPDTSFSSLVYSGRAVLSEGPVTVERVADAYAPLQRRAIAAARAGTMQASREQLRSLALRIQLGEQRSLTRLEDVYGEERG